MRLRIIPTVSSSGLYSAKEASEGPLEIGLGDKIDEVVKWPMY